MLYRCQANHDGLQAGTVYDLDPADVAYREGAIEAGFLTPEHPVVIGEGQGATFDFVNGEVTVDGAATHDDPPEVE